MTSLSDLEFRVWLAYQLTADDYGVMRKSAVTIQAADDALALRPAKAIQAALKRLVDVGLVNAFDHQGRTYIYQETWQNFQRVKHPRDTMQPAPPNDQISACTAATQKLFLLNHPVFVKPLEQTSAELPQDVGKVSEILPEEISELGSLACARTRETANGQRLMANGSEGMQGESAPMDIWARELVNLYPAQGRCGWNVVERPLFDALMGSDVGPLKSWEALKGALANHKRSHQWRIKQMIPRLDKWLREGLYLQELPEHPVTTLVNDKTAGTLTAAAEAKRLHR